jgi:hypothetical protein
MRVEVAPVGTVPSLEAAGEGTRMGRETSVRSKILSHFVKGKISPYTHGNSPDDTRRIRTL